MGAKFGFIFSIVLAALHAEAAFSLADYRISKSQVLSQKQIYTSKPIWATHRLPLHIVILKGSDWTPQEVRDRTRQMAKIFAQCQVQLSPVVIYQMGGPSPTADHQWTSSADDSLFQKMLRASAELPRPLLHYVKQNLYGGDRLDNANAYWSSDVPQFLQGVGFIPRVESTRSKVSVKDSAIDPMDDYFVDAHELCHLGCRYGHDLDKVGHLMSWGTRQELSSRMPPWLCDKLRSGPYTRAL